MTHCTPKNLLALFGLCIMSAPACKSAPRADERPAEAKSPLVQPAPSAARANTSLYGSAIGPGTHAKLSEVLAQPAAYEGKTVVVEGEVRRVCKKMGCWMELATANNDAAPSCRVFFGAHQFFIPKDSDGARARVQGEIQVQKVQASFVEHLEQEGATFKSKNPDGTANEVRLVASGVELTRG
jgi:hypothetical protein